MRAIPSPAPPRCKSCSRPIRLTKDGRESVSQRFLARTEKMGQPEGNVQPWRPPQVRHGSPPDAAFLYWRTRTTGLLFTTLPRLSVVTKNSGRAAKATAPAPVGWTATNAPFTA